MVLKLRKMKKKIFSLLAVVIFAGNSLNLNAKTSLTLDRDCVAEAIEFQNYLEDSGLDKELSNAIASTFYDLCMGSEP